MIKNLSQAYAVQSRRRNAGLKGRSKAVRRWFKRIYGRGFEAHTNLSYDLRACGNADFSGCRRFDEVHK